MIEALQVLQEWRGRVTEVCPTSFFAILTVMRFPVQARASAGD